MERTAAKTTNSPEETCGREMKRVAAQEHPTIVGIPLVVGMAVVRVEPEVVGIALDVEHVEIAIRVGCRTGCHQEHRPSNTLRAESDA